MENKNNPLQNSFSKRQSKDNAKKRYKKPDEVKELERLYFEFLRKKYPSVPEYAVPSIKFRDDKTNELTKCVTAYCLIEGIFAERVANTGRNLNGKWIKGTGTNGTADIHAVHNGKSLKIEIKCKATKDRQSEVQKAYQRKVEKAGAVYLIVREFKDFYNYIKNTSYEQSSLF